MRILIVDDSSTMRRIIGNVVMQLGFSKESFDEAEDGLKAWKLLTEGYYFNRLEHAKYEWFRTC